jgi:SNF2 family DNA or RNA helicase
MTGRPVTRRTGKPLFIADEVQRLRNQGKNYQGALTTASEAKKRILLSGTPLVNAPGDMASIINLLHGKQMFTPEEFENKFVGEKIHRPFLGIFGQGYSEPQVNNRKELDKLLEGRVHYVGDVTDTKPSVQQQEIRVPMSPSRTRCTSTWRVSCPCGLSTGSSTTCHPNKQELVSMNSFLSGMRQVSLSPNGFDKRMDPYEAFQQSPKLLHSFGILNKEMQNPRGKVMVYSNFIDAGLRPYASALERNKIPHVMFYGGMNDAEKQKAVASYNAGKVRVVLIGPAGAEGISLKGTTRVQMLDPHWNLAKTDQAQGRAVRSGQPRRPAYR